MIDPREIPILVRHTEVYTVDLVIFACLDFREFVISGLYTESIIRELSI